MLTRLKTKLRPGPDPDDLEGLFGEIESLSAENRVKRSPELESRIRQLRHLAGVALTRQSNGRGEMVEPDFDQLPKGMSVPEVSGEDVTPELIRAAILEQGALLVRGLIDTEAASAFTAEIDGVFQARDIVAAGKRRKDGYYDDFWPEPSFDPISERLHVAAGGGVLATDSPKVLFGMTELFEQADMRELIGGYLGEQPTFSAHKTTLRHADPSVPGAWHQDGKFMGDVNSVNLWLSLSHCGDTAPGMDLVPRRLEEIVDAGIDGAEGGFETIVVTQEKAEELAGEDGIVRPVFEPGDAMFFDHLYLHQTASDPSMPNPRYAIESWFFGPSAFPGDYIPLAY